MGTKIATSEQHFYNGENDSTEKNGQRWTETSKHGEIMDASGDSCRCDE